MAGDLDELELLRRALEDARSRIERDRLTIEALQAEIAGNRRREQHQVRNILSVMRSIARRTVEEGETAEDYQARLDSRLASFARLQSHILRDPARGIDLCGLISDELLAYGIRPGEEADVTGEPVCLAPRAASIIGLAFHELGRMAIEGGASGGLDGRIDASWQMPGAGGTPAFLTIDWVETGRQPRADRAPDPRFGTEVLEQAVAYELGGAVQLRITGDGLACRFQVPHDHVVPRDGAA